LRPGPAYARIAGVELVTERLRIREFVAKDLPAVHRYASDPQVTSYMDWGPNDTRATDVFLQQAAASASSFPRSRYAMAVVRRDRDELIGSVELHVASDQEGRGVLGYVLARDSWGNGYATEAATALLRYGFDELGLRSITATCDPDNIASAAVLNKIGMHAEGCMHHSVYVRAEWRDRLLFAAP
jgi:RimJ/RimL family protein N-acetyltransferase